jgi:hypothetical protein
MAVSRPVGLQVGSTVAYGTNTYTVSGLSATRVVLVGAPGGPLALPLAKLVADAGFAVADAEDAGAPLPPRGLLDGLAEPVIEKARWWERQLLDVLQAPGGGGREGSAAGRSLRQRELNKVTELAAAGEPVPLKTLQRMRRRYQRDGLLGLVDGRIARAAAGSDADERLMAAIGKAVAGEVERSTGTVGRLRRRVEQILADDYGLDPAAVAKLMPPRSSFYRLVRRAAAGRHTFGSAPTRRSLAARPDGPFARVGALRPGEWMQIDSTPLDVRVVDDDGQVDRAELTWLIDVATRSIPAAVLRPSTKAVDASLLLARALTPEPMRPGWADALAMARSVLPHQRLVELDERLAHAAARPVIVPETIVCDHGKVYLSRAFRAACQAMAINFQPTHPGSPWEKGVVERSFGAAASLFAQHVAGYVGRSVDRRGAHAERGAVWSLAELSDLLDEWIVAVWQNRQHDGLRHPLTPGAALSPNEAYAALIEVAGYVAVPLGAEDYLELLPATWRVINAYGVKINHRTYDCDALNPYRRQDSGVASQRGRWEVHHDPYDVTRVWVRNHHDGGWITVPWTHLRSAPAPFGEQAWACAQDMLARRGGDQPTETEIASAVAGLLDRAEAGPANPRDGKATKHEGKADRRVAARTRATASMPAWPRPAGLAEDEAASDEHIVDAETEPADEQSSEKPAEPELAPVIPLGVFDAHAEAERWW